MGDVESGDGCVNCFVFSDLRFFKCDFDGFFCFEVQFRREQVVEVEFDSSSHWFRVIDACGPRGLSFRRPEPSVSEIMGFGCVLGDFSLHCTLHQINKMRQVHRRHCVRVNKHGGGDGQVFGKY